MSYGMIIRDLIWKAGDTEELVVRVTSDDNSIVDLTGATFLMQLRNTPVDPEAELSLTGSWDPETGLIEVQATPEQTRAAIKGLMQRMYVYDLQITHSDGKVKTIVSGKVLIKSDVTR